MRSLIFGIFMVMGGASGKLVLIGTNSSGALVVVGVLTAAFGLYQLMSSKKSDASQVGSASQVAPSTKSAESMGLKK
jgi:uncharacterized membrane protein YfcA